MAETQKEKIMRILNVSAQEADAILETDKIIDKDTSNKVELPFDLTAEQKKAEKKMRTTGTRTPEKKKPTVYTFKDKSKTRKENPLKIAIIAELATFLKENAEIQFENVEILNETRQIAFNSSEYSFELTLTKKNKAKKG